MPVARRTLAHLPHPKKKPTSLTRARPHPHTHTHQNTQHGNTTPPTHKHNHQEWNREGHHDADVLLGVEDVFRRDPLVDGNSWGVNVGRFGVQFEQWTLAGAPHHEVYCRMSKYIK